MITFEQFRDTPAGNARIKWAEAEERLGFKIHDELRNFYSRHILKGSQQDTVGGEFELCEEDFVIPSGNEKFDTWFSFNGIEECTEFDLFPIVNSTDPAEFVENAFSDWTGGNDFGHRAYIGELFTDIGQIALLFNNDTGKVEWADLEYGYFENFDENPHGTVADTIVELFEKLSQE